MNRSALPFGAIRNKAPAAPPRLSVLVPVYRHDASPLLSAIAPAAARLGADVEVLVYDDGSRDPALTAALSHAIRALDCPAMLLNGGRNGGRAVARNALVASARARHVLFLDADMIPDEPYFLDRWLAVAKFRDPAAAFGGFSMKQAPTTRETALHRYVSIRSECKPAANRSEDAAQFTATSNLLVRRDILEDHPFDDAFNGWGWEDVEWALRVSRRHAILHIDNPATHAGLDTPETLLRKYQQSVDNYRRLAERHPNEVRRFKSHRIARFLSCVPGQKRARGALSRLARAEFAPMFVRHAALKLFRTSLYAEVLS